jgi:hypothetical protein
MAGRSRKRVRKGVQFFRLDSHALGGCRYRSLAPAGSSIFENAHSFGTG